MKTFADFEAFYAYYLASHSNAWNRRVHLLGWIAGIALLGHRFIERNDSVVFAYPLWTTCADVRMFSDMARGRLPR